MKRIYLILAIVGAILPYIFFFQFMTSESAPLGSFLAALFVNGAAAGFTVDLLVTSLVFWLWMAKRRSGGGPNPFPFILLNLAIGLSCALPAYLYFSESRST
jgi:hypothetical protein